MSGSVNTVMLVGRVGQDPAESKSQGDSVSFSLATSEKWLDAQGQRQERTDWHRIRCRSKVAELARAYVAKGDLLAVEGRLSTYDYQSPEKGRVRVVEVVAIRMVFLSPPPQRHG
jgi:single-strand DNA-binding protein